MLQRKATQPEPSITSCGNIDIQYNDPANCNITNIINNYNTSGPVITDEGISNTNAIPTIESQNDEEEVFPNNLIFFEDQSYLRNIEILELIWKYLPKKDKLNCTLMCKQINSFVSSMDCFNLNIDMRLNSFEKPIPILTRNYTTICIKNKEFYRLDPLVLQMLKHLSESVIRLKLIETITSVKTFRELLGELPNLKSLEMIKIEFENFESYWKFKPKLLMLTNLKIELGWFSDLSGVLSTFGSAKKIQSFSLFKARLQMNEFNTFLDQHKNSLESLDINLCKIYTHSKKLESGFRSFDRLYQLRKLHLINNNEIILKVLKSKCFHWLQDFELKHHSTEKEKIDSFLLGYMLDKNINELQLIEYKYKKYKQPIIVKSIVSKFYHIHYCSSNTPACDHEKCKLVPLTNLKTNFNRNEDLFLSLSIKVRKNLKDFDNITEVLKCNESNIINDETDDEIMIKIQEFHQEIIKNNSTTIAEQELILKTVWKYLNHEDKLKCTRVCKNFNSFISSKDCFNLNMALISKTNIPILTRDYKTVSIEGYSSDYLKSVTINMLKQLRGSVINLELECYESNVLTLCSLLYECPLVESLTLRYEEIHENDLSMVNLPKFLHLRTLIIGDNCHREFKRSVIFDIFDCAQNLESLELESCNLNFNELNSFLDSHKNKLNSINLIDCHFRDINPANDLNIFDCLHQLRVLKLTYSDLIINKILASKCIHLLTDLEIFVDDYQIENLNSFLQNYFKLKEINEHQLIEYEAKNRKEPIVTKTKCPNSDNIITTSYNVHYCELVYLEYVERAHNKCKSIPLINLGSNSIRDESCCSYLSIKVT